MAALCGGTDGIENDQVGRRIAKRNQRLALPPYQIGEMSDLRFIRIGMDDRKLRRPQLLRPIRLPLRFPARRIRKGQAGAATRIVMRTDIMRGKSLPVLPRGQVPCPGTGCRIRNAKARQDTPLECQETSPRYP